MKLSKLSLIVVFALSNLAFVHFAKAQSCGQPKIGIPGIDFPQLGHAVGNGAPIHPSITSMSLTKPVAGIDFPTDTPTPKNLSVLVLAEGRILISNKKTKLIQAVAGDDYPTDSTPPLWTCFSKILVLDRVNRIPVTLGMMDDELIWSLPSGKKVLVRKAYYIEKAVAGTDYPTDSPVVNGKLIDTDFYVLVTLDGDRIRL